MGTLPKPLSNDELNAIRAKAQAALNPQAKPVTAEQVGYETGIKALVPVVERIEVLEAQVKELLARNAQLDSAAAAAKLQPGALASTSIGQVVVKDIR